MPTYRMGDGFVHIKMRNTAKHPAPPPCCARVMRDATDPLRGGEVRKMACRCMAMSSLQCDWRNEDGRTCDAPLCAEHGNEIGPDQHLCALHFALYRAAEPELLG